MSYTDPKDGVYARTVLSTPSMRGTARAGWRRTATNVVGSARGLGAGEELPDVGAVVGNYVLVSKLGEGAHGAVYRAHRVGLEEQRVALKIIPSTREHIDIVRQELVTLATVVHPNIVQLNDHGSEGSFAWFTMPFYEGAPLDALLAKRFATGETLSVEEAYEIFLPLAGALAALHAAGFRHQDIKPENVFLARFADKEHPILLDLGVAISKDNQKFLAGTREYFAPEQLDTFAMHLGLKEVDPPPALTEAMDVYGLAATLLLSLVGPELAPGARLLRAESADLTLEEVWMEIDAAQKLREREPLAPQALRAVRGPARRELTAAFRRWFSRDATLRPTAVELTRELRVLLARGSQSERRRRLVTRVALGAATLLMVGAPVAYAGGRYAVSLRECKDRVAQDALKTGEVAHNLEDCQTQAASLMQRQSECGASLTDEKQARAGIEKDLGAKLASSREDGAKVHFALNGCQGERDAEKTKVLLCGTEKTKCEETAKACAAAKDDAQKQLATSQADVAKCGAELTKSGAELAKSAAEVGRIGGELTKCAAEKTESTGALQTCNHEKATAAAELRACKAEATSAGHEAATAKASLAGCASSLSTCTTGLAACHKKTPP